ncbi:MAG: hypothetical protein WCX66_04170, partial [archaeon]
FFKDGFVPIHKSVELNGFDLTVNTIFFEEEDFVKVNVNEPVNVEMKGAGLSAPVNSFVVKGTNERAIDVGISLTPFDPTSEEEIQAFPGDFEGELKTGEVIPFESFGFAKVQAENSKGEKLDLAKGKKATLKIPISTNQIESSPSEIPFWYFDEVKGMWVEKGIAKKTCSENECYYEGEIDTIASWWNCDAGIGNSGGMSFSGFFGSTFFKCVQNPLACIKDWAKTKYNSMKDRAKEIWEKMKNNTKEAYDKAKDFFKEQKEQEKNKAKEMADNARNILNSGDYDGSFVASTDSDGKLNLQYTGPLESMSDLADCAGDLQKLFPDASSKDIFRMMRNSTFYGEYNGLPPGFSNPNLGDDTSPLLAALFNGGELQHEVKLTNPDGGLFLNSNDRSLSENGFNFDAVHYLVGVDSTYSKLSNGLTNMARFVIPGFSGNVSSFQSVIDFTDSSGALLLGIDNPLGQANPSDLRGNVLATYSTSISGSAEDIIRQTQENFSEVVDPVNVYENLIYNPIVNDAPIRGIPLNQVISEVGQTVYNDFSDWARNFHFEKDLNESKKCYYFSQNEISEKENFNDFWVNPRTGELKLSIAEGLLSYSQFDEDINNRNAYPFSVLSQEASNLLYSDNRLGYIIQSEKKGVFFDYDLNKLNNIFFVFDQNYYMKYEFYYEGNELKKISNSFANPLIELTTSIQFEYNDKGLLKGIKNDEGEFEFEYDDLNRVFTQKIKYGKELTYSIKYIYGKEVTTIEEYYGDFEILFKTINRDYSTTLVNENVEENISMNELIYLKEFILSQESESSSIDSNYFLTAVVKGKDYASISKKYFYPFQDNSFELFGKPNGKAVFYFLAQKKAFFEETLIDVPSVGESINISLDYAFVFVPIEINSDYNKNTIHVQIDSMIGAFMVLDKNDGLMIGLRPNESKEINFSAGLVEKTLKIDPLKAGEMILTEKIELDLLKNSNYYKVFDCNGHYAYIKRADSVTWEELYFDGVKVDEGNITELTIFDNHYAYVKDDKYDLKGNECEEFRGECKNRKMVFYDGNKFGLGEHPQLWGNHIGYCKADYSFGYDENVFSDADCMIKTDFTISHNNYAYKTKDGSIVWNGEKIVDSKEEGAMKIDWIDGNNLITQLRDVDYFDVNGFKKVFKNGKLVQSGKGQDSFFSSIGTIWVEEKNSYLYKNGERVDYYNPSLDYTFFGENNLVFENLGFAVANFTTFFLGNNLIFNGKLLNLFNDIEVSFNETILFDNHHIVTTDEGVFVDGVRVFNEELNEVKLFEDNWIGSGKNSNEIYFNGKKVGERIKGGDFVIFKNNYAFGSADGLVYNGKIIDDSKQVVISLFGDNIYWEDYTQEGGIGYYINGELIGVSNEVMEVNLWPSLNAWQNNNINHQYGNMNPTNSKLMQHTMNNFLNSWDYCMKYPSEISE